jgi:hypothetical protein
MELAIAKADHGRTAPIRCWWRRSNYPRREGGTITATAGPIAPTGSSSTLLGISAGVSHTGDGVN